MFSDVAKKTVEQQKNVHQQSKEFFSVFREEVREYALFVMKPRESRAQAGIR